MKRQVLTVSLGVIGVVLLALIIMQSYFADKTPPEITFGREEIFYDESEDDSVLLEGVKAIDDREGDVSRTLIIKNIYRVSDKYGIVVYAAKDRSNNVTTASRGFTYEGTSSQEETENSEDESDETPVDETAENIGDTAAGDGTVPETDNVDGTVPEDGTEPEAAGDTTPVDGTEGEQEQSQRYQQMRQEQLAAGGPFIKLMTYEVTLQRGDDFVIQRYIEELVDNVDSENQLARYLHIRNWPDMSTVGDYEVSVYVNDSDGNVSNTENLVVKVE